MSPAASIPFQTPRAVPRREPGQIVDAVYRREGKLRYTAEEGDIVGRNGEYFNNRPLYCNQSTEGAVLTGDRPFVRLIAKPFLHGALALALVRDGHARWLHDSADVESRYRCGRMTWRCTDPAWPDVVVTFAAAPLPETAGFAARFHASGLRAGDQLIWAYGGAQPEPDPRWKWDPVMQGNPDIVRSGDPRRELLQHGLIAEICRGNAVTVTDVSFRVAALATAEQVAVGRVSRTGKVRVADGSVAGDALALAASVGSELPLACGTLALSAGEDEVFFAVETAPSGKAALCPRLADPARAFADSEAYLGRVERAVSVSPDARLDAALLAVNHAVDGNCERDPYIFRHGCMAFSCRFVGWRVICGATALGWHERVLGSAVYTIGLQKKADPARTRAVASTLRLLTHEGNDSRLYGKGALDRDFPMYDVQSQFFDQTINDWRATADPAMERLLRPALELHLEWLRECFDPDDDGLYESYINTLPTDSVWYNGGGSVEASAYAYTGHKAAADMARRAGDTETEAQHRARCEKIQRGLRELLWLPERGHFGLYREQGGHRRVHADAWTYSVFLAIDAGITSADEALQSLYFTEWALERIPLPFGGELCQLSNWVPWKWSVRDMFGGDLFHLALAYFQTGLGDGGYSILQGATLESAYASAVPGGFSHIGAATDFGDCVHMFARAVVEGLYGYVPDYPNGTVLIRPAFPSDWPHASIATPDFSLSYRQKGADDCYVLALAKMADVTFRLPVRADAIRRVTINGAEVTWQVEPGFGCTQLTLSVSEATSVEVIITLGQRVAHSEISSYRDTVNTGGRLYGPIDDTIEYRDYHGVLETPKVGHHLVLTKFPCGELPRWEISKINLTDPATEALAIVQSPRAPGTGAQWACLDLASAYNADVRTIFQQRYLSPRPETCSVRLGVDGYSAWTFPYWNLPPPVIDLDHVAKLSDGQGRLLTPAQVPFRMPGAERNIAFTSLWDNWPTVVAVPVGQAARTAWLLVCGTTFPMQTNIANAVLRFRYADDVEENLELIPPHNFWMMCPWGGCDYDYAADAFALPKEPPLQVQLGNNCRAILLSWKLRPEVVLESVTLETLSEDVVIGLMGLSLETA